MNLEIGYGCFYGKPRSYFSEKLIFRNKKKLWSPMLSLYFTTLDFETVNKMDFDLKSQFGTFPLLMPSFGYEYMDNSGLTFDVLLGVTLLDDKDKLHFRSISITFRVAGHF